MQPSITGCQLRRACDLFAARALVALIAEAEGAKGQTQNWSVLFFKLSGLINHCLVIFPSKNRDIKRATVSLLHAPRSVGTNQGPHDCLIDSVRN